MTINNLSDLINPYQTSQTNSTSSVRQDFKQLSTALSSGNISDAQSAFANLLQSLQTGGTSSTNSTTAVSTDLQTL